MHRERRHSSQVLMPKHLALQAPGGSHGAFWSPLPLSFEDALPFTRVFQLKTKPFTPGSLTRHHTSVHTVFFYPRGFGGERKLPFSFFMSIKNKHAEKLPFSLFIKPQTTHSWCRRDLALTKAISTIYKRVRTNLVKGRFPLH